MPDVVGILATEVIATSIRNAVLHAEGAYEMCIRDSTKSLPSCDVMLDAKGQYICPGLIDTLSLIHIQISTIFIVKGKHQTAVGKLFTGDIGAVVKLQYTQTNDTLCEKGKHYLADPIVFSEPMLAMAVFPKSKNDEDKMSKMCIRDRLWKTPLIDTYQTKHSHIITS